MFTRLLLIKLHVIKLAYFNLYLTCVVVLHINIYIYIYIYICVWHFTTFSCKVLNITLFILAVTYNVRRLFVVSMLVCLYVVYVSN